MRVFKNGLATGMILQMAIGPVFFYIVNLTLQKTMWDGFAGVIGVTLGDYVYITLAIIGIGKVLERKKVKKLFGIFSSFVLMAFGILMIKGALINNPTAVSIISSVNIISSFTSVFLLTVSSPLTIMMWTSLFAAKTIEYNYTKQELFVFGLSTGLATFIFMSATVLLSSLIKGTIPVQIIQLLNIAVGCLLAGYGILKLKENTRKK